MAEVFDLRALVSADVSPFEKAMDTSASSVTSSLSLINTAANAYIGSGFIRTLIKATNTAYEFEQVMADISSISSVNTEKMAKSIRGLDNVYGKLSDVANSAYEIISSGFDKSSDEVLHFQKIISTTAKTIRADIDATTNAMTTLANAYGIPIENVQKISDMLFVTVREGKANGNELARTLGLVTNTAAEAGVTLAEMAATISILSRTQSASQSMIGFNQMLNSLIKPTQEAQREAERWGIEIGAAALQSKGFTAILTEMHEKIGGNVEAINAILGNIRAMRAGTALTGRQFENFIQVLREAEREIGTGVSLEAFAKQTATAQQALKDLAVQADKTYETIGKDFEPITKNLVEAAESILKSFQDASPLRRWNLYASALYVTLNGIRKVVRDTMGHLAKIGNSMGGSLSAGNPDMRIAQYNHATLKRQLAQHDATFTPFSELAGYSVGVGGGLTAGGTTYGAFSPEEIKDHYRLMQKRMSEQHILMQDRISAERKIIADKIRIEHDGIDSIKDSYGKYRDEMNRHLRDVRAYHAEALDSLRKSQSKLSKLSVWDYTDSSAIMRPYDKTVFAGSGGRSFYNARMSRELSTASMQYATMVTEADIDKVLQKNLNPLKSDIQDMAKANISSMYHLIHDEQGNVSEAIDPKTRKRVSYDDLVAEEAHRISEGYRSARLVHNTFTAEQIKGTLSYEQQQKSLTESISKQKATVDSYKQAIERGTQALEQQKAVVTESVRLSRERIKALKYDMSMLDDTKVEERKRYNLEIQAVKERLKADLRAYNDQKRNNADRLELQRKIAQAEAQLLAMEDARMRLLVQKRGELAAVMRGVVGNGLRSGSPAQGAILRDLLYDPTARNVAMSMYRDSDGSTTKEGRKAHRALALQRLNFRKGTDVGMDDLGRMYELNKALEHPIVTLRKMNLTFSKIANGAAFLPLLISTAVEGFNVGKEIAEHFKLADTELFKFVGKLKVFNAIPGFGNLKTDVRDAEDVEPELMKHNRELNSKLILRMEKEGGLTESAAALEMRQMALAKTTDELIAQYKRLISKTNTKVDSKQDTYETLDAAMAKDLAGNTETELNAKQLDIIGKSRVARTSQLEALNKETTFSTLFGRYQTLNDTITQDDFNRLISQRKMSDMRKVGDELIKRSANIGFANNSLLVRSSAFQSRSAEEVQQLRDAYVTIVTNMVKGIIRDAENATKLSPAKAGKLNRQANEIKEQYLDRNIKVANDRYTNAIAKSQSASAKRARERELDAAVGYDSGTSTALSNYGGAINTFLYDTQVTYDEREKAYTQLQAEGEAIRKKFKEQGLGEAAISKRMTSFEGNLITAHKQLKEARAQLDKQANGLIEASAKELEEYKTELEAQGIEEGSTEYVAMREKQLKRAISTLNDIIDNTLNKQIKDKLGARVAEIEGEMQDVYNTKAQKDAERRSQRLSAGEIGEATATVEEIADLRSQRSRLQEHIAELSESNVYGKQGRIKTAQNELARISLKLAESMNKLDDTTRKLSDSMYSTMHNSLTKYDSSMSRFEVGRMSNNTLFHNLNMLSRITGPELTKQSLMPVTSRSGARYRDSQSRLKAEQDVYASIDSYIMSKKYEEANIGKAVTNIYDYIRNNNKIMVSK